MRIFRVLQILSIDIVLGAVILFHFFCSFYGSTPTVEIYIILGVTVWLIYTIDHLRDATRAPKSTRVRYQFHLKHQKALHIVVSAAFVLIASLLFFLDTRILIGGITLALLSGFYLVVQGALAKRGLKELYVAFIYTSGILLTPFLLAETFSFVIFSLLFLLTYCNLILFSWFERGDDLADRFVSIATIAGSRKVEALILIFLALGISVALLRSIDAISSYFITAFVCYSLLLIGARNLKYRNLYRVIGDGVFLLPVLF